jgi:hypothetical protein
MWCPHIQGVEWILVRVHRHFTCNSKNPRILATLIIFQQDIKCKSCRVKKMVSKFTNISWSVRQEKLNIKNLLTKRVWLSPQLHFTAIVQFLRWRHDFLPRFLIIETTETKTKKRHVYLLMVTLRLLYAPVNLTIFFQWFLSFITLITNITLRSNCQHIWNIIGSYLWSIQICFWS